LLLVGVQPDIGELSHWRNCITIEFFVRFALPAFELKFLAVILDHEGAGFLINLFDYYEDRWLLKVDFYIVEHSLIGVVSLVALEIDSTDIIDLESI